MSAKLRNGFGGAGLGDTGGAELDRIDSADGAIGAELGGAGMRASMTT